jgi:endogenous inhibitor of DNA gyrase (YacG/DUF329 family)
MVKLSKKCYALYKCANCGVEVEKQISDVKRKKNAFCGKKCNYAYKKAGQQIPCDLCGKLGKYKHKKYLTKAKHHYCGNNCKNIDLNSNPAFRPKKAGRSKLEKELEMLLKTTYPNLQFTCNDRIVCSGIELDFYFSDLNLAIEINGPFHYEPIFGQKAYEFTKNNDYKKRAICEKKGVELIIIPAVGNHTQKKLSLIMDGLKEVINFAITRKKND